MNDCIYSVKSLKNDESITRLFRNSDLMENVPELAPVPDVKTEVEEQQEVTPMASKGNGSEFSDVNGSPKKPHFVQVKNRQVFDYEPNASSIHASLWPHWWLKAVHARHDLRKSEARKNARLKEGLRDLFQEALEVGTIFCLENISFHIFPSHPINVRMIR